MGSRSTARAGATLGLVLAAACGEAGRPGVSADDLCAVDAGRQVKALLRITQPDAARHFDLLEKWAAVGRPREPVAREALYAVAASEHPRALEVLDHHLATGRRGDALRALADHRGVAGVCDLLAREWVAGPDPDPGHEALLLRAMVDGPLACSRHLAPFAPAHPDRVAPVLGRSD